MSYPNLRALNVEGPVETGLLQAEDRRPDRRIFGDVNGAAADNGATARDSTEFRKSHSHRHKTPCSKLFGPRIFGEMNIRACFSLRCKMPRRAGSAISLTIYSRLIGLLEALQTISVPLVDIVTNPLNIFGVSISAGCRRSERSAPETRRRFVKHG